MNSEFWWPAAFEPADNIRLRYVALTREERAVLKRLLDGEKPRKAARRTGRVRYKATLRRRRRALVRLDESDIRSLLQIMVELGL